MALLSDWVSRMVCSLPTVYVLGSGAPTPPPVAFHPRDPVAAIVGGDSRSIKMVDCSSGTLVATLSVPDSVVDITFNYDGDHLVAIGERNAWIWSLKPHPILAHTMRIAPEFYDDYRVETLLTKSGDLWVLFANEWQFWATSEGRVIKSIPITSYERMLRVSSVPVGNNVAVTADQRSGDLTPFILNVWDIESHRLKCSITQNEGFDALVSHDAKRAVIWLGGRELKATFWDLERGAFVSDIAPITGSIKAEFCSDNQRILARAPDGSDVPWTWLILWDAVTGLAQHLNPNVPYAPQFCCSPFHSIFATIANDERHPVDATGFWSSTTGEQIGATSGHVGIAAHRFSRCGRWFASICSDAGGETTSNHLPGGSIVITDLRPLSAVL